MTKLNKIIIFVILASIIFFAYCDPFKKVEPYVVFGRYRRYIDPIYYNYGKYNTKWYADADNYPEPDSPKRVYIMPHRYYHY